MAEETVTKKKFEFLYKKIKSLDNKLITLYENEETRAKDKNKDKDKENYMIARKGRTGVIGLTDKEPLVTNNLLQESTAKHREALAERDRQLQELMMNVDKQIQQVVQNSELKVQKMIRDNTGTLRTVTKRMSALEDALAEAHRSLVEAHDTDRVRAVELHKMYDCQIESIMASISQRTNETLKQIQATLSNNRTSAADDLHGRKFEQKVGEFNEDINNKLNQMESSLRDDLTDSKLEHEKCWSLLDTKIEEMNNVILRQGELITHMKQDKVKSALENENRSKMYEERIKSLEERLSTIEKQAAVGEYKTSEIDNQVSLLAQAVLRLHEDGLQQRIYHDRADESCEDDHSSSVMRSYANSVSKLPIIPEADMEDDVYEDFESNEINEQQCGDRGIVGVQLLPATRNEVAMGNKNIRTTSGIGKDVQVVDISLDEDEESFEEVNHSSA